VNVEIYSLGLLCCSVCAPVEMTGAQVADEANRISPPGTQNGWSVSEDETFKDGTTVNGAIVECCRGKTRHWLLDY
jgi:hypothetical protein